MRSRLASAALAVGLLGGAAVPATVLVAPAASAHSVLLSSEPADGATLEASPEEVSFTFNEEINQSFATIAVTTADDRTNRTTADPVVEGPTVRAEVDELPPGEYTAGYRVTSADGHVVSGSATFTVGGADGSTQDDATRDAPDQVAEEDDESNLATAFWVVGGLAVLLVVGGFFLLRRGD